VARAEYGGTANDYAETADGAPLVGAPAEARQVAGGVAVDVRQPDGGPFPAGFQTQGAADPSPGLVHFLGPDGYSGPLRVVVNGGPENVMLPVVTANRASWDVQTFTAPGAATWTKPPGAVQVQAILVGGGAGGGSGRRDAAGTARGGGGGGAGGARIVVDLAAGELGATAAVVVGAGSPGGAAVAADTTNGTQGTAGGVTTLATLAGIISTGTAGQGLGGLAAAGGGGGAPSGSAKGGSAAGVGSTGAANGGGGSSQNNGAQGGGGGGGGGGLTVANAQLGQGSGFWWNLATDLLVAGGVVTSPRPYGLAGGGGSGGAASVAGAAAAGGIGQAPGGGGGGGGASVNGQLSGAGGPGADGMVIIRTLCLV
jgi:hypothetical protein